MTAGRTVQSTLPTDFNSDEAKVAPYTLPDPLRRDDGTAIEGADAWFGDRRPELLSLFEEVVFGRAPEADAPTTFAVTAEDASALGGRAVRREATLTIRGSGAERRMNLLLYLPRTAPPFPVILGPNFLGNHTVHPDLGITLPSVVFYPDMDVALPAGRASEASRGFHADRWPVERFVARGYAFATFYAGDVYPDRAAGRPRSVQPLFDGLDPSGPTWGAVATWSWGMSRALDALRLMSDLAADQVVLFGHSRHGKAALWAGALDRRFAVVIANNSGKGGASLARRDFGERIRHLVGRYPHWFAASYRRYSDRESELPLDQHMLLSLIAPRPLYIASATEDLWADPKGEFLAAVHAAPVYRMLGTEGLAAARIPEPNRPVTSTIGYHLRSGTHGVTDFDWTCFLDFADGHLPGGKPVMQGRAAR